ncbi:hypothetical protein M404DRAFT_31482 [Pisolithus tinctorius Marx 270]|uniref:Crinkler effector protein N-terminal domain-containing protein n=1 Tax=Pisolithus tinctorius Marx 270 TaxID=870435 RepID=A0A0C3IN06_PISTI|nr:hypothetical protein M404DRAFT_31482 [Pisolithus tinctorius Marx 270]
MSDDLTLSFWVRGTSGDSSSHITISPAEKVNTLKQLIKENEELDVPLSQLRLFKLKDPLREENLGGVVLSKDGELLRNQDKLSEVFPAPPPKRHLHIIVDAPYPEIYYWFRGADPSEKRIVRIQSHEDVTTLKQQIQKSHNNFSYLPHSSIKLFRISEGHLLESLNMNDDGTLLNGRHKISTCFEGTPVLETFCVVVQFPSPDFVPTITPLVVAPKMTLNCWEWGDDTLDIFPVEISSTLTVGGLKRAIKKREVSLPCNEDLRRSLEDLKLSHGQALEPWRLLSDSFSDVPLEKHLHIVFEAPRSSRSRAPPPSSLPLHPQHRVSEQRGAFLAQVKPNAPSSIAQPSKFYKFQAIDAQTIYCNRPADAVAIVPPTLLHRAFGDFLHACNVVEPTYEDNSFVMKLHTMMSNHYDDERERAVQLRELFKGWGLTFVPSATHHGYMTDGDMREGDYRYAIADIKNGVGSTQADPYNRATLYYMEFSRQYAETMAWSPLPCFIILLFGPLIMFAGAAWNVRPVIQPLSFVLPLHYHPTDTYMQTTVARHLKAFKTAVLTLKGYYRSLSLNNVPSNSHHSQLFPYPTSFKSLGSNATEEFEYISQYPDKLIFFGTLAGEPLCIKFVRHYSMEVHLFSASRGRAPALRGFDVLHGGWYMVVMDSLDGYKQLCDVDPPPLVFERIRTHLDELHYHGYVHGDVRSMNIMVSGSDMTEFMFVDFDWAGKIGEVRYPLNVNREIWRPPGVSDGALIKAQHDMDMLELIISRFDKGDKRREDDQVQRENMDERESKRPRLIKSVVLPTTGPN